MTKLKMLYGKDAQFSSIYDIARPKQPILYLYLYPPTSQGRILSEMKDDRRQRRAGNSNVDSLCKWNFPPVYDDAQKLPTPPIKHRILLIFPSSIIRQNLQFEKNWFLIIRAYVLDAGSFAFIS